MEDSNLKLQKQFDITIELLRENQHLFPVAAEFLSEYKKIEVDFNCFDDSSSGPSKEHLLRIYEIRGQTEKERAENPHVTGYDTLLPALRQTNHKYVCISDFCTYKGSLMAFSDFDRIDLIGILFSKTTLLEIRLKMEGSEDYKEHIFIEGRLQINTQ